MRADPSEAGAAPRDDPAPPLPPVEETDEGALERGIDLVIGATARGVRMASLATDAGRRAIEAVGSQPAGRATTRAVNALTEPLAREGAAWPKLEDDMPVAARNLSARVVPAVIETIDPDNLLDAIDLDAVLARIDLEALLGTLDLNILLAASTWTRRWPASMSTCCSTASTWRRSSSGSTSTASSSASTWAGSSNGSTSKASSRASMSTRSSAGSTSRS